MSVALCQCVIHYVPMSLYLCANVTICTNCHVPMSLLLCTDIYYIISVRQSTTEVIPMCQQQCGNVTTPTRRSILRNIVYQCANQGHTNVPTASNVPTSQRVRLCANVCPTYLRCTQPHQQTTRGQGSEGHNLEWTA